MKPLVSGLKWFVSIAVIFFLVMTSVRILFNSIFLHVEYNMPGFPEDPYGFSKQDRLYWGTISIDYMNNQEGIDFLAKQRLSDGTPLYNERELSHMLDVKILFKKMVTAWYLFFAGIVGIELFAWKKGWLTDYWMAISHGGQLTIGLILVILFIVAISFNKLFTAFHRLFFTGDTWLFLYSDSLIRLFPLRFWQDAFIGMGIMTILGALLCILGGKWLAKQST